VKFFNPGLIDPDQILQQGCNLDEKFSQGLMEKNLSGSGGKNNQAHMRSGKSLFQELVSWCRFFKAESAENFLIRV
jgi:hypothetical protein